VVARPAEALRRPFPCTGTHGAEALSSSTPETLGRYTLLSRIAVGETTEIHKARADGVGGFRRMFALKRVRPELADRAGLVDHLVDEARTTGLLSHANIVQIMDLGEEGGSYTVAMEHIDGVDLARVLARCQSRSIRLPVPQTAFIGLELLKALDYAHTRTVMRGDQPQPLGIVHLAIAPENLLLSWQGEVKLTDFGCARTSARALAPPPPTGTAADYASPELAGSTSDPDARSDLFSVGVVLYEMLTGRHPFRAKSAAETRAAVRRGGHEAADAVAPELPAPLARIVDRALSVDRRERFASAAAMKEALDGFLHETGFVAGPSGVATFLRNLFPDDREVPRSPAGDTRPMRRTNMDADPVTHPMAEAAEADDRPTAVEPPAPPPTDRPRPRPILDDLSRSKAFGPLPSTADESTLVKRIDVLAAAADEWGDAPTRIRPAPGSNTATDEDILLPDPEDEGRPTLPSDALPPLSPRSLRRPAPEVPQPRRSPLPPVRPAASTSPPPTAPTPAPARKAVPTAHEGRSSSLLWLAVGAVGAGIVLGAGVLLGLAIAARTPLAPPPTLSVSAPVGVFVTVGDSRLSDGMQTELTPGEQTLRVTSADGTATELTLTIVPGEHRMLRVESAGLPAGGNP